ncbi:hypothetical protein BDQ17DRAFT_1438955 [Cyathus striatus]|nr:hypothetical protein BDQ17DRAFT_1438955 [Cyathus striatus]
MTEKISNLGLDEKEKKLSGPNRIRVDNGKINGLTVHSGHTLGKRHGRSLSSGPMVGWAPIIFPPLLGAVYFDFFVISRIIG